MTVLFSLGQINLCNSRCRYYELDDTDDLQLVTNIGQDNNTIKSHRPTSHEPMKTEKHNERVKE